MKFFLVLCALSVIAFTQEVRAVGLWSEEVVSDTTFSHEVYNSLNSDVLVSPDGVTTYAYYDQSDIIVLQKGLGSSTTYLPSPGSPTSYERIALATNAAGEIYIAYGTDDADGIDGVVDVHIKKYNGSTWELVGTHVETSYQLSFIIDQQGRPVLAAKNPSTENLEVWIYGGSTWDLVGGANISSGAVDDIRVIADTNNALHVAYVLRSDKDTIRFSSYNGIAWVGGGVTISEYNNSKIDYIAPLVGGSDGSIFVAYRTIESHEEGGVFRYDSSAELVQLEGSVGGSQNHLISIGSTNAPSFHEGVSVALNQYDIPYFSYISITGEVIVLRVINGVQEFLTDATDLVTISDFAPITLNSQGLPEVALIQFTGATNSPAQISLATYSEEGQLCRFYSSQFRGHFYTSNPAECIAVRLNNDWKYEGVAYNVLDEGDSDAAPVYRFWSELYKHHFYTANLVERDSIIQNDKHWAYEGVAYHVYGSQVAGSSAVYRFWSDAYQGHFYTASKTERDDLESSNPNWRYEGIAWYIAK